MTTQETKPEGAQKDYYKPTDDVPHEEGAVPIEPGALTIINTAEINQQIATARRYPRSVQMFRRNVFEMVTYNMDVAESCIYAVPRDGKMIDGPSIRFAEILQTAWGNYRSASEVTDVGTEYLTAEGVFFDLENNGATKSKIMRRIVGKTGKRYSVDMIATTGNAACSIGLRNAILRGIPKALWYELLDEAKKVAGGSAQTFSARREKVIKELGIQGATPEMIFALLGVKGIEDMRTEHLIHLRGLQNAIRDGETSMEDAFQQPGGTMAPPRPDRSAFTREADPAKAGETKPHDTPATEATPTPTPEERAKEPDAAAKAPDDRKAVLAAQFKEWMADNRRELAATMKARAVSELNERVGAQLDGEERAQWDKDCDARIREILDATKKK